MVESNRDRLEADTFEAKLPAAYSATGHPSIEQLMVEQESIEEFLETLHEWRGHKRTDPAAGTLS